MENISKLKRSNSRNMPTKSFRKPKNTDEIHTRSSRRPKRDLEEVEAPNLRASRAYDQATLCTTGPEFSFPITPMERSKAPTQRFMVVQQTAWNALGLLGEWIKFSKRRDFYQSILPIIRGNDHLSKKKDVHRFICDWTQEMWTLMCLSLVIFLSFTRCKKNLTRFKQLKHHNFCFYVKFISSLIDYPTFPSFKC